MGFGWTKKANRTAKPPKWLVWLWVVFAAVFFVVMLGVAARDVLQWHDARTAPGTVLGSLLVPKQSSGRRGGSHMAVEVTLEFQDASKLHQVTWRDSQSTNVRWMAERRLQRYPAGAAVRVYWPSGDIQQARPFRFDAGVWYGVLLGFNFVAVGAVIMPFRPRKRARHGLVCYWQSMFGAAAIVGIIAFFAAKFAAYFMGDWLPLVAAWSCVMVSMVIMTIQLRKGRVWAQENAANAGSAAWRQPSG